VKLPLIEKKLHAKIAKTAKEDKNETPNDRVPTIRVVSLKSILKAIIFDSALRRTLNFKLETLN
jgi:hypothetical protein